MALKSGLFLSALSDFHLSLSPVSSTCPDLGFCGIPDLARAIIVLIVFMHIFDLDFQAPYIIISGNMHVTDFRISVNVTLVTEFDGAVLFEFTMGNTNKAPIFATISRLDKKVSELVSRKLPQRFGIRDCVHILNVKLKLRREWLNCVEYSLFLLALIEMVLNLPMEVGK
jgi:hypothetical protein